MKSHRFASALLLSTVLAGAAEAQTPTLGVDTTNFDRAVRPQDDFYRFVNGTWLREFELPEDRSTYGSFTELSDKSEAALRAIIEEAARGGAKPGTDAAKLGAFYRSYMDTARIESLGIAPLRSELDRISDLDETDELPELFAHLQSIRVQTPFGFYVGQDPKNATRYIATLSQGGLGLPDRDYYLSGDEKFAQIRAAYHDYIATLLRLAGDANPAKGADAILALETALAEKQWPRAKSRDREATYNLYTEEKLEALTPAFDWSEFLGAADAEETPGIIVRQPDYFEALGDIVRTTPLETWRQYLTFKLVDAYADELSSDFVDARFDFRGTTLSGLRENRARWKRGIEATEGALGEAAGRLYVERNFRPESKARMEELVGNLMDAFRAGIDNLEWMSPATRAQAKEKLEKFNVKIAYPDEWEDYSDLEIRDDDLVGNVMRASRREYAEMIDRLGEPIDRTVWGMTPQTVNAYYSASLNEIVFPAAILQPPFFDPAADDAVNYGAIGAVIGHEISHGFDDQGRRSDGDGNLRDWWTAEDAAAFEQRADRLVEQYNALSPVEGLNVNGRLTLGENIGDLSGIAVAYQAYKRSLNGKEAPVIDGFTGDQRFFMGWAQIWRRLSRDEALRQQVLSDPHSPGEYRVNAVLRNFDPFYAAFGVEPGDGMYLPPAERVKIW